MRFLTLSALALFTYAAEEHCDEKYECKYHFQTSSDLWYWDFSPLCSASEYVHTEPNPTLNSTYHFNICGLAQTPCDPPDWDNPHAHGVAVQMWGDEPECPPKNCKDPQSGQDVCCTKECEILGTGRPSFLVNDEKNPETGGVNITHDAVPPSDNDPNECPYDPKMGGFKARSVVYHFRCDKHGKKGHMKVKEAYEGPQCHYNIVIDSWHGCGRIYSGPDSAKSARGKIAGAFFGGILTTVVLGGVAYWYFFHYRKSSYSLFGSSSTGTGSGSGSGFGTGAGAATSSTGGGYSAVGA